MTNNDPSVQSLKRICREAAYGPDKILLTIQFPDAAAEDADALRKEILAILDVEPALLPPSAIRDFPSSRQPKNGKEVL